VQDPLDRFAQAFTRATGHKVNVGYSLTGPILADIKAGKPTDAIVLPEQGKVALVGLGLLDKPVPVAASLAGVGVRADAPTPDVSTLEAFKALLRATPSISYTDPKSGGAFGQYFARALVEIGMADEVARKAVLVAGSNLIGWIDSQLEGAAGPAGISGYQLVTGGTENDSVLFHTKTVYCPTGKKPLGGGGFVNGVNGGGPWLVANAPTPDGNGWSVTGTRSAGSVGAVAYVICAFVG